MSLPDLPSELLTLALADLEKCEADPNYKIHMEGWYRWVAIDTCYVCLAGAVMAQELHLPENIADQGFSLSPAHFNREEANKLRALDILRRGDLVTALRSLDIEHPKNLREFISVHSYHTNPERWKSDMQHIISLLKSVNL